MLSGMMSALDVAFKQVVDKLKERDLYDNTIIVVTTVCLLTLTLSRPLSS